jgi:hypothetical protein
MVYLFLLWTLQACNKEESVSGEYLSAVPGKLEILTYKLKSIGGYTGGESLVLRDDSSFIYKTCGHIINGRWIADKDSMYLIPQEALQRIDSMKSNSISLDSVPFYKDGIHFAIKGKDLFRVQFNRAEKLIRVK